ncbi:MAG TPA: hypothetical protein VLL77_12930 [Anaerolineales bacterium]|nr:hypothetical protein [Anaerolineales bacterium]
MAAMNLGAALERLETRQLIRAIVEAEPTFTFKHNLVQQVAYESMLVQDRKDLHRLVGEVLEQKASSGRLDLPGVLAAHFEQAGIPDKALRYATVAGDEAMRRFAAREAADHFGRAIAHAQAVGVSETDLMGLHERRGRCLDLSGQYEGALETYEALERLGRDRRSASLECAGILGAASLHAVPTRLFDPPRALALSERALVLARKAADVANETRALWIQLLALTRIDPHAAVRSGEAALSLAREHGLREREAYILNDIASNYFVIGETSKAARASEEARPIWRELDNLPMLADSLSSLALLRAYTADYDQVFELSAEAISVSDRIGNLWGQSYSRVAPSFAYFGRGELGPAILEMQRCIQLAEHAGFLYPQVALRSVLAIVYALAGDAKTSAALTDQVRQFEEEHPSPMMMGAGLASRAWLATWTGDLGTAERYALEADLGGDPRSLSLMEDPVPFIYAQVDYHLGRRDFMRAEVVAQALLSQADALGAHMVTPKLHMAVGQALFGQGRRSEARAELQTALEIAGGHGVTVGLWEIEMHLAELAEADGRSDDARRDYAGAAEHAEAVAIGLAPLGLDDAFRRQPIIQMIFQRGRGGAPGR